MGSGATSATTDLTKTDSANVRYATEVHSEHFNVGCCKLIVDMVVVRPQTRGGSRRGHRGTCPQSPK